MVVNVPLTTTGLAEAENMNKKPGSKPGPMQFEQKPRYNVLRQRSPAAASRRSGRVIRRFAVGREVETFAFGFDGDAQADDQVDDLVEDRRTDARPQEGG